MNQERLETELSKQPKQAAKRAYRGFSFQQRLVPAVLLALTLGVTLCLIGPYDIFFNNIDEFLFFGKDFALWNILFSLALTGAACGILLPLRGRAFDVTYAILFAVTLMLFVQGNYLNGSLNSLAADGVGEVQDQTVPAVINAVVWGLVLAGSVTSVLLLRAQAREWIPTVGTLAMVTALGMQLIPLAVSGLTAQGQSFEATKEIDSVLTYEGYNEMGTQKNVYYFVVDRFDQEIFEEVLASNPDIFKELDGFTNYNDMISLYPRTYPSVPYMLTGIEHDFEDARVDYLNQAYRDSKFLKLLHEEGYEIGIYTDDYYGYSDAESMSEYVTNQSEKTATRQVIEKTRLSWDMVRLSLYRYLPLCLKNAVGDISTPDFQKYVEYSTKYPKYSSDMKNGYEYLKENQVVLSDSEKNFSFIHLAGCHLPNVYNEHFRPASGKDSVDTEVSLIQSFKIIDQYLVALKEAGLYENATIIISGDHGSLRGSDTTLLNAEEKDAPFLTALLVKPSGSANEPLKISSAPIAQGDVIPTILQSEGIETEEDFGRSIFEVQEGEQRERRTVFHSLQYKPDGSLNYEEVLFRIVGSGRTLENWSIESRGKYVGDIYH